jgi:hypothetical protein
MVNMYHHLSRWSVLMALRINHFGLIKPAMDFLQQLTFEKSGFGNIPYPAGDGELHTLGTYLIQVDLWFREG